MPYTRAEFIPGAPGVKVSKFKIGSGQYDCGLRMVSEQAILMKQEALEAARVAINSLLQKKLGDGNYVLRVTVYPHVVLREHKFAAVAGADRLSQGMRRAFGRPTSRAVNLSQGQGIFEAHSNEKDLDVLKQAFKIGAYKLPMKVSLEEIREEAK